MFADQCRWLGFALAAVSLAAPRAGWADDDAGHLIALAEPVIAEGVEGGGAGFAAVYVVTAPTERPRRYAPDLPKASAAVCGRVALARAPPGQPAARRFFATFPIRKGTERDSQVAFTIEDNDPADLSPAAMERSARFLRGWRQYCVDAAHPN